jgi:hypothetical protein
MRRMKDESNEHRAYMGARHQGGCVNFTHVDDAAPLFMSSSHGGPNSVGSTTATLLSPLLTEATKQRTSTKAMWVLNQDREHRIINDIKDHARLITVGRTQHQQVCCLPPRGSGVSGGVGGGEYQVMQARAMHRE